MPWREQFGQQIGKFQGVSFKLADMALELKAAELLTREAGWKYDQGTVTDDGHGHGQAQGHGSAGLHRRRGDPDPRRHGPDGAICRWSASGATRASSASGKAPAKSSATSSAAPCCGRLAVDEVC
jgi:alkylation response protein AidB-like acyl-CoA dehydrogenase